MNFQIHPYLGAGPVKFGMTTGEVQLALGPPGKTFGNWDKSTIHDYGQHDLFVGFDAVEMKVHHLGFGRKARLFYKDIDLFSDEMAFTRLLAEDPNPQEFVGFIYLVSLGLQLEGFHEESEQKNASVLARDYLNQFRHKMKPWMPRP